MKREVANIRIEDIDFAVYDWFKNLNIHVETNAKESKRVEVVFFPHERWHMIRAKKALRDKNGTIKLPLISVLRTDFDKTPGMWGVGQEVPQIDVVTELDEKSPLLKNLNRKYPVYKITSIPFPEFVTVFYSIMIWSSYMVHCNEILERIYHEVKWRYEILLKSRQNYSFIGLFEPVTNQQNNLEEFTDEKRILRYTLDLKVPAYLMLEPKESKREIKESYSAAEIAYNTEVKSIETIEDDPLIKKYRELKKYNRI